ncbi:MAG: hypothetical protein N2449_09725 [Bacteroidales bacterium]|nr:hypothetical protein [Bacteroidales bacterium]
MIKYFIYIFNLIGILFLSLFDEPVFVTLQAPEEATAGSSIVVEVKINKANIKGFARYTQLLPIGYTAEPVNLPTGDFTFKDQKIIVGWLSLPKDCVIAFSYRIKIDPTAEGPLFLTGIFSYIEYNERKNVESPTLSVIIRPAGYVAQQVNNNEQQQNNANISQPTTPSTDDFDVKNIFCYREVVRQDNQLLVHLLVNTADLPRDKYAKLQEAIPPGFQAAAIETNDGIFSFKDNTVKFLWMALPPQRQFVVSYKLTPTSGVLPDNVELNGSFSYIENETTKMKSIQNRNFLNEPIMASVNKQKQESLTAQQIQVSNNQPSVQQQTNQNQQQTGKQIITQQQSTQQKESNKQKETAQQKQKERQSTYTNIPEPETGIRFRVQIAAGHKPVNPKYYFKQYNITEPVRVEQHEGWHKYTVGSFGLYKEARDKRVQIWQTTPIRDAFVSAYNNGVRITVQEALMIANQKWVQ